ncbi:MAG: S26 family signal peptidase [Blautia sp.]
MVIVVVVVVLLVNNVILINAKIPSESMEKTIMTGDRIFVFACRTDQLESGDFEAARNLRIQSASTW